MMLSSRARRLALIAIGLFSLIAMVAASIHGLRSGSNPAERTPRAVSAAAPAPDRDEVAPEELDRLRSLGYIGSVPPEKDQQGSGVLIRKGSSRPGYNFFTNTHLCSAALVDEDGAIANYWEMKDCHRWSEAELLDTGDLLVVGRDPARSGDRGETGAKVEIANFDDRAFSRFLALVSWNGTIIWKKPVPAHHDVERLQDRRLILLTVSRRMIPQISATDPVRDNRIALLSEDGEEVESLSFYDLFRGAAETAPLQPARVGKMGEIDIFHANSVEAIPPTNPAIVALVRAGAKGAQAPGTLRAAGAGATARAATAGAVGTPGTAVSGPIAAGTNASGGPAYILTSIRHQDTIAIVDWRNRSLLWTWGLGEISGPHDATMLPDGHILFFDNGLARRWSRVLEVDPVARKILWEYRSPDRTGFFSASRGSSQRLEGGNTLIAESDAGRAFEVTANGEIVWEFRNPFRNAKGERATITRIRRVDRASIERIIQSRGLGRRDVPLASPD